MKSPFKAGTFPRKLYSRQFLVNLILSYLIVILVPLISFAYHNRQLTATMRRTVTETNDNLLQNMSLQFDSKISDLKQAMNYLLAAQELHVLKNQTPLQRSSNTLRSLQTSLSLYSSTARSTVRFLLYFESDEFLLSEQSATAFLPFFQLLRTNGLPLASEEWQELLTRTPNDCLLLSDSLSGFACEPSLVLCQVLYRTSQKVHIYVSIPLTDLPMMAQDWEDQYLLLTDKEGKLLYSSASDLPFGTSDSVLLSSGSTFSGTDKKRYISTCIPTSDQEYYLLLVTPEDSYWSVLQASQRRYYISLAAAVLSSILFMVFFVQKNYHPIHRMMQKLSSYASSRNELQVIEESLGKMQTENSSLSALVRSVTEQLHTQSLLRYLKTGFLPVQSPDTDFIYPLKGQNLWMVMIRIGKPDAHALEFYRDSSDFEQLSRFCLQNICGELFAPFSFTPVSENQTFCYLIHPSSQTAGLWISQYPELFATFHKLFEKDLHIPAVLSYTPDASSFETLPDLYQQLQEFCEITLSAGLTGIVPLKSFKEQEETLCQLMNSFKQPLSQAAFRSDEAACRCLIREFFQKATPMTGHTFSILRLNLVEYLLPILKKHLEKFPAADLQFLMTETDALLQSQDACSLQRELTEILSLICRKNTEPLPESMSLTDCIKAYVEQHYPDCNLCVNEIAGALGKNPQYLSHYFITQTKIPLSEYINSVRIEHACSLIRERKLTQNASLEAIAVLSGFSNVRTFRRVFTKITGLSPSQWRDRADL